MKRFLKFTQRKITLGNLFSIMASIIFAVSVRYLYLYYLDYLPVKGDLEALDISYFGLVIVFRFIFRAFLEYYLDDKFSMPLFGGSTLPNKGVEPPKVTPLSMVNSDSQGSVHTCSDFKKAGFKNPRPGWNKENELFNKERAKVGDTMWDVLREQTDKLHKLFCIKLDNDVKYYQENGGLELSVPNEMTDAKAEKLSKQVGALDRSIQNKFSEYENLSRKDVRLYESS